jgi:mRNA deadenylase 3'-5' endonuclease subunit Ccr4
MSSIDERIESVENSEELIVPIDVLLQNIDKLPKLSIDQVERLLTTIPYKMEQIENKIVALEMIYDEAVARQKTLEAQYKLKSIEKKQSKELLSEGDRTAWVNTQQDVILSQNDSLKAKNALKAEQVLFNRYDRNFIAVRKIASLLTTSETVMGISQKYV